MLEKYNLNHYHQESSGDDFADWMYENTSASAPEPDVNAAWEKVSGRISQKEVAKTSKLMPLLKVAAVVALLIASVVIVRNYESSPDLIEVVSNDETKNILLPDGTEVTLSNGSLIKYPEQFGNSREVTFTGEAFFNVQKSDKPFNIKMNGGTVEVLGTAFNLSSSKKEITLAVTHGKVALSNLNESVELAAGAFAKLDKSTHQISVLENVPNNTHSWRTGEFSFDETPLGEAVRDLEKYYKVTFRLNQRVAKCRLTADFDNLTLDELCEALKSILSVNISQKGTNISIKGKGCE